MFGWVGRGRAGGWGGWGKNQCRGASMVCWGDDQRRRKRFFDYVVLGIGKKSTLLLGGLDAFRGGVDNRTNLGLGEQDACVAKDRRKKEEGQER